MFDAVYTEISDLVIPITHDVVIDDPIAPTCTETGLTEGRHCSLCNTTILERTEVPATGHTEVIDDAVAATCTVSGLQEGKHCSVCNEIIIAQVEAPALGHDESEDITRQPTCTVDGSKTISCSRCSAQRVVSIDKHGHQSGGSATCEQDEVCTRENCGAVLTRRLGHNYDERVTLPTCTDRGYTTYTCTSCGDHYQSDFVDATGHDLQEGDFLQQTPVVVKGSNCAVTKTYTAKCPTCLQDVSKDFQSVEHTYVAEITTPATCSDQGVKTYACSVCQDSYTKHYSDDEAHDWVNSGTSGVIQKECSICHEERTSIVSTGTSGTVSGSDLQTAGDVKLQDATLVMDSEVKEQLKDGGSTEITVKPLGDPEKQIALQNAGLDAGQMANIGTVYDFSITNERGTVSQFNGYITIRLPYSLDEDDDVDNIAVYYIKNDGTLDAFKATYSNGYITFVTDHFSKYVPTKLTPEETCTKFGHDEETLEKAATCTEDGYTITVCKRCGVEVNKEILPALPHAYTVSDPVDPTCTTHGRNVYICACGDTYTEILPATGHEYQISQDVPATCQNYGYTVHTCRHCADTYTEAIAQLPHTYEEEREAATCTAYGFVTNTCSSCGIVHTTVLPATGHNYSVTSHVNATCTKQGYTIRTCLNCEAESRSDLVPALGHDYEEIARIEATCVSQGYTEYECLHCHNTQKRDFVSALGHQYQDVIVPPMCETDGYTISTCSHCQQEILSNTVAAIGHDYRGTVTDPTCASDGYTTYVCEHCEHTYMGDHTTALGHNYEQTVVEPSCETGGYTLVACSRCNDSHIENETESLGHELIPTVIAPTCTEEGYTEYVCERCNHYAIDSYVAPTGHVWIEATCTTPNTCDICDEIEGEALGHMVDESTGVCIACGEQIGDVVVPPVEDCKHENVTEDGYCPDCGVYLGGETECYHENVIEDNIPATCTQDGYMERYCPDCNQVIEYQEFFAFGHQVDESTGICYSCNEKIETTEGGSDVADGTVGGVTQCSYANVAA